jgi:hypothetical protein
LRRDCPDPLKTGSLRFIASKFCFKATKPG